MAWSDAARAAALEARRRRALRSGDRPAVVKGVFWRAGPTNNITGTGIRFGDRVNATQYVFSPGKDRLARYYVKLKNPLVASGWNDALVQLKLVATKYDARDLMDRAMHSASKRRGDSKYGWMAVDKKITAAAKKQHYGGIYYTDSVAGGRGRKLVEAVAFKKLGSVRELPHRRRK